jgi:predicted phosphodiesterase
MRVLILSDIHANLAALETVLNAAEGHYDTIWCLGDIVGYGPRPNECVELIRAQATLCVMGNHDLAAVGHPDIDLEIFNPYARQAVLWTRETLTEENLHYLAQLPDHPIHPPQTEKLLITHASPREPVWEYIFTPNVAWENFCVFTEEICLFGHTHKPAIFRWRLYNDDGSEQEVWEHDEVGDGETVAEVAFLQPPISAPLKLDTAHDYRLLLNPGSVGQPRDNDARAAYAILDLETMLWQYERIAYPIELTQSQMRAAQLPRRLIDRLSYGW